MIKGGVYVIACLRMLCRVNYISMGSLCFKCFKNKSILNLFNVNIGFKMEVFFQHHLPTQSHSNCIWILLGWRIRRVCSLRIKIYHVILSKFNIVFPFIIFRISFNRILLRLRPWLLNPWPLYVKIIDMQIPTIRLFTRLYKHLIVLDFHSSIRPDMCS